MAPFDAPVSAPSGPKEDHRDTNNTAQVGFALPADRQRPETLNKYYATGTHAFDDRIWSHILVRVIDRVRADLAQVEATCDAVDMRASRSGVALGTVGERSGR